MTIIYLRPGVRAATPGVRTLRAPIDGCAYFVHPTDRPHPDALFVHTDRSDTPIDPNEPDGDNLRVLVPGCFAHDLARYMHDLGLTSLHTSIAGIAGDGRHDTPLEAIVRAHGGTHLTVNALLETDAHGRALFYLYDTTLIGPNAPDFRLGSVPA